MQELSAVFGPWTAIPDCVMLDGRLSKTARLVYCAMLTHARPFKGKMVVWAGVQKLAEGLGFSVSMVKRGVAELQKEVDGYRGPLIGRQRRMGTSTVTTLYTPLIAYEEAAGGLTSSHGEPVEGSADGTESILSRSRLSKEPSAASGATSSGIERIPLLEGETPFDREDRIARRKKPDVLHNTPEFKARAEKFRVLYDACRIAADWSPCNSMPASLRRSLYLRDKEGVLDDPAALFRGMVSAGQGGFQSDIYWLLGKKERCIRMTEQGKRGEGGGEPIVLPKEEEE